MLQRLLPACQRAPQNCQVEQSTAVMTTARRSSRESISTTCASRASSNNDCGKSQEEKCKILTTNWQQAYTTVNSIAKQLVAMAVADAVVMIRHKGGQGDGHGRCFESVGGGHDDLTQPRISPQKKLAILSVISLSPKYAKKTHTGSVDVRCEVCICRIREGEDCPWSATVRVVHGQRRVSL